MKLIGESYHLYNRGAHKAPIFHDNSDYERFIALMFVSNDTKPLKAFWYTRNFWSKLERTKITSIFSYCLMPNHFHIGLRETNETGSQNFVHKLLTAYTMYYNKKYDHSGTIFQGNYKFKHIDKDNYLRYLIDYIHLNPYGIEEPDLTRFAKLENRKAADAISKKYEYSSYKDYLGIKRPQNVIIDMIEEVYPPRGG